jgi:hypothetical protein
MGFFIDSITGETSTWDGISGSGAGASSRIVVNTRTVSGQIDAFRRSSTVQSAVTRRINAFANLNVWAKDRYGKRIINPTVEADMDKMQVYNPYQTKAGFESQLCAYRDIFGVAYVYKSPIAGFPNSSDKYVIPNNLITPKYNGTSDALFQQRVVGYTVSLYGGSLELSADEVEVSYDNPLCFTGYGTGESRLIALAEPISTLLAIGEVGTQLRADGGARGIIGMGAKDIDMLSAPFLDADKKAMQTELKNYGGLREQFKYIITKTAMNYVPLTSKIVDMDLTGGALDATIQIFDRYGIPSIFASKEPRFKAMPEARKEMYTATIIPEATNHYNFLLKLQGIPKRPWMYQPDWSHMDFFQESLLQSGTALQQVMNAITPAREKGFITQQQFDSILEPYLY